MGDNRIGAWIRENATAAIVIAFLLGLLLGLVVLGWWVWPVRWTNADPADLRLDQKEAYLQLIADSYALTGNSGAARSRLEALKVPGQQDADLSAVVNSMIGERAAAGRADEAARLQNLVSGLALPQPVAGVPVSQPPSATSQLLRIAGIAFFLVVLGSGIVLFLQQLQKREGVRRRRPISPGEPPTRATETAREGIAPSVSEATLGQFETTYRLGDEGYDISYSIESATGEFLGECGVSALEEIGLGEPGRVSAFEVWLFDKEDVRTETKVLMSDQAFTDETLREKLANKGTLVQAERGKIVAIETANLRLNGTISELEYENGSNSVFAKLTTALEISRR